ncbi:unnamed protein product [Arabis nemorensis]|uniref:Uncharacterized protein n=1 Tax=Arabis nemorensis TaxID=586526 RepID=A0A565BWP4_9BRAS|nr:unnamed protein product [Arabis nemorensis]
MIYVSFKAAFVFSEPVIGDEGGGIFRSEEVALFVCSSVLAIGHIVVAYRTSCRERRKLLVFKIDIESKGPKDKSVKEGRTDNEWG